MAATTQPKPGDTWTNQFGRRFRIEATNVHTYRTKGQYMGEYAIVHAIDDPRCGMYIFMSDLTKPQQIEMLM